MRIRLKRLIIRQKAVIYWGTTCFKTQNSYIVKFSWALDKRKLEVEQLKLAEDRGV